MHVRAPSSSIRRALFALAVLLLPALAGCGGGGVFGSERGVNVPVLREAIYVAGSGSYTYRRDIRITGAPDDSDFSSWAMLHDGAHYRLYVMRLAGEPSLYRFTYDGGSDAFQYDPAGAAAFAVDGVPDDADFSSIAMLHSGNVYRLYARSRAVEGRVHQFYVVGDAERFQYGDGGIALPILDTTGMPGDADFDRFAMHHDGSDYRMMVYQGGSGDLLYQAGYNTSTRRYQYGYHSRPEVTIEGMPADTDLGSGASLHDGSAWRYYHFGW